MDYHYFIIAALTVIIVVMFYRQLRLQFLVGYYQTKCQNRGIATSDVEGMSLFEMMFGD